MTANELITMTSEHWAILLAIFLPPPAAAIALGWMHGEEEGGGSPHKYVYAFLIYFVTVPGVLAAVLTAYTLFFTRTSLLDVNILVYGLPLLSMAGTLFIMGRNVDFDEIPGFDRLWGLIVMVTMTFVIILVISRTRIWVFFGGSIWLLFALAGFIFALLKWGAHIAFRRSDEPKRDPPQLPTP